MSNGPIILGVPVPEERLPISGRYRVHDRGLFMMDVFFKRSEDVLDYFIDLWNWLEPGETIEGARGWAEPGTLDVVKVEFADTGVLVWCANGDDGARNIVHCRIITSIGREKLFRFRIDTRGVPGHAVIIGGGSTVTVGGSDPITVEPDSLSFPATLVDAQSAAQHVIVTNNSTVSIPITSIATDSAEFVVTGAVTSIAPGASVTLSVKFAPTGDTGGARTGQLSVVSPFGAHLVSLSGLAQTVGVLTPAPTSLTFTSTEVGDTSAPQSIVVTNTGSAPVAIASIAAAGNFAQTNDAGATLDAGAFFTIAVTFSPLAVGLRTGSIAITSDLGLLTIPLSGTAIAAPTASIDDATIEADGPISTLSAITLDFDDTIVGASSPTRGFFITNDGTADLTIASIVASGDFSLTHDYTAPLAPGAHATVTVTFSPTATGARTGSVTVTSDADSSPQTVDLTGTGLAEGGAGPSVSLDVSSLTFPDTGV